MKKIILIILSLVLLMSAVCCSSNPVEPQEVSVKAVLDFSKVKLMEGDKIYFTAEWQFNGETKQHKDTFIVEDPEMKTKEVVFKARKVAGSMKVSVIRPFDTATKDVSEEGYVVAVGFWDVIFGEMESYTLQVEPVDDYLTFTGENVTVTPNGWEGLEGAILEYSVDGGVWTEISNGTPTPKASVVKFRGTNGTVGSGGSAWEIGGSNVSVFGNIMTVLDWKKPSATIPSASCFSKMFCGQGSLIVASGLLLPATTLADSCYYDMFSDCSELTTAPALPARTLAESCYSYMFYGCSKLTTAPALTVTTLADSCYAGMFYGCSKLTTAPALPAKTLADSCYSYMFYGCSKMTTAPELPATVLAEKCYSGMFCDCECLSTLAIPNGEDSVLPAKELKNYCYAIMFAGCSSLKVSTAGDDLQKIFTCPATSEVSSPVSYMFTDTGGTFTGTPCEGETYYWY